jgi:aspartyl-tRNA(Asn)/glutamyl-tRNA(Gln) amidotransferase subunit B
LEIVTKPEMRSPEEARAFLEEIRLLLRELKVSDCEMQEGSLRVDANVNIHLSKPPPQSPPSQGGAGRVVATPIVEVKNLNSFRAVERAIAYEAQRQFEEFKLTGTTQEQASKETAGWDDSRGITVVQRRKEEASDYRYFPEPDLVPVEVDEAWLARVQSALGELPAARRLRFQRDYQLSAYDAGVLVSQGHAFAEYFEELARRCGDAKVASNWCTNQVLQVLNERKIAVDQFPLSPEALAELIAAVRTYHINMQRARDAFASMVETGQPAAEVIRRLGLDVAFDPNQLRELIRKSIAANPKAVADVKAGKAKALDALVGPVMRETKGKAPTDEIRRLLQEELQAVDGGR